MPGPLKKPQQFQRHGRRLPGQSSDEELGLERGLTIKVVGGAAVLDQEMALIGQISQGRYVQIGPTGIYLYAEGSNLQIWHDVDGGAAQSEFRTKGTADDNDAIIGMSATNYAGDEEASIILQTYNYRGIFMAAEVVWAGDSLRISQLTTTQRNNLPVTINGMIVYNSTTGKFQGYAAGAWVDLH